LAAASQEEHSFFVAQDARSMEEAAKVTVRSRIIEKCRLVTLELRSHGLKEPLSLLSGLHWSRWWWWWLGSAGDEAAGEDRSCKSEEGVFHNVVFVVFVVIHTACSGAHGISEK
jgi:hypothetical protein